MPTVDRVSPRPLRLVEADERSSSPRDVPAEEITGLDAVTHLLAQQRAGAPDVELHELFDRLTEQLPAGERELVEQIVFAS